MGDLDVNEFRRWQTQAESALSSAQLLADVQPAWSCFCSEQAAQLAVKGLLHAAGLEAWGHDLVELESRLHEPLGAAWHGSAGEARRLARHYIPTRYPDAHPGGSPADRYVRADALNAIADAEAVVRAVGAAWSHMTEGR